ncbi:TPA: dTMP kinase, partial [Clostridioides difficile]
MQGRGQFITLEGGEGSGKTTMIASLDSYFREKGTPYIVTREPGGIEI